MRAGLIGLLGLSLAAYAAEQKRGADRVERLPAFDAPLAAESVVSQLRDDLTALSVLGSAAAASDDLKLSPSQELVPADVLTALRRDPPREADRFSAGTSERSALERISVARNVIGQFNPERFDELPEGEKREMLAKIWGEWRERGLVGDAASTRSASAPMEDASLADLDRLLLEGIDDRGLTSMNKSIFLGSVVLGYPLEDAVWINHVGIRNALDENTLRYPEDLHWKTGGMPQFLGRSREAQSLVDDWSAAARYGRWIVAQVRIGSKDLPASHAASPEAAAAFADLAAGLKAKGDERALDYLASGEDPTFVAFLLDVRKPGYYLYNAERATVERIMATHAVAKMGIRRLEHGKGGAVEESTYFYRPRRVAARLREIVNGSASQDAADSRSRIAAYSANLADYPETEVDAASVERYRFIEPRNLPGSALDSSYNELPAAAPRSGFATRVDFPFTVGSLRESLKTGRRPAFFDDARWKALETLARALPPSVPEDARLRIVSEAFLTRGKKIARMEPKEGRGVIVQLSVLDDFASRAGNVYTTDDYFRFVSAALAASLR